jgi:hypothetical protein
MPNLIEVSAPDQSHQFRTRNDLAKALWTRSIANENTVKSTILTFVLPLITVWLQARVRANHLRYQSLITFTVVRGFAPGSRNSSQLLP